MPWYPKFGVTLVGADAVSLLDQSSITPWDGQSTLPVKSYQKGENDQNPKNENHQKLIVFNRVSTLPNTRSRRESSNYSGIIAIEKKKQITGDKTMTIQDFDHPMGWSIHSP